LLEALPAGNPTITEIASRMGLSQRNLQRKLADAGTSFTKVLEEMRIEIASRYLAATSLSLKEIAFLLGYNEPSSFFRAFRKLTGETPLAFRTSQRSATTPVPSP
jgi:AraC-like DNA-binding protein